VAITLFKLQNTCGLLKNMFHLPEDLGFSTTRHMPGNNKITTPAVISSHIHSKKQQQRVIKTKMPKNWE